MLDCDCITLKQERQYLSVFGHVDVGDLVRLIGEHVVMDPVTNEEVLLCCLQVVAEEANIPVSNNPQLWDVSM